MVKKHEMEWLKKNREETYRQLDTCNGDHEKLMKVVAKLDVYDRIINYFEVG
jgi:hypothetical protein